MKGQLLPNITKAPQNANVGECGVLGKAGSNFSQQKIFIIGYMKSLFLAFYG